MKGSKRPPKRDLVHDHWNLRISGIDQRLANQAEIVCGSAHAAGLRDGERGVVYENSFFI